MLMIRDHFCLDNCRKFQATSKVPQKYIYFIESGFVWKLWSDLHNGCLFMGGPTLVHEVSWCVFIILLNSFIHLKTWTAVVGHLLHVYCTRVTAIVQCTSSHSPVVLTQEVQCRKKNERIMVQCRLNSQMRIFTDIHNLHRLNSDPATKANLIERWETADSEFVAAFICFWRILYSVYQILSFLFLLTASLKNSALIGSTLDCYLITNLLHLYCTTIIMLGQCSFAGGNYNALLAVGMGIRPASYLFRDCTE